MTLNRDVIKYFAMVTMLGNHVANIFMAPSLWRTVLIDLGYFTAPVMCYFLVEGYHYTHSKAHYAFRLALFAALSQLPFSLAFSQGAVLSFVGMNMLYTLLICFAILVVLERVQQLALRMVAVLALTLLTANADWALMAPIFTLLFSWAWGSRERLKQAFVIALVLFGLNGYVAYAAYAPVLASFFHALGQMSGMALAALVLIYGYNGKRMQHGRAFSKWFFYVFYPGHLLVLGLIRLILL